MLSFSISTFSAALPSGKTGVKNQHFKAASRLLFQVPEILSDLVSKLSCKGPPPTATPVGTMLPSLHTSQVWLKTEIQPQNVTLPTAPHSSAQSSLAVPVQ